MRKSGRRTASPIILIAGDVHGHWDVLAQHVEAARNRHGRLDGVICVGDVQAFRSEDEMEGMHCPTKYKTMGSFPKVLVGEIEFGCPVWFIGGNHEPWPALDLAGPGEWAPGVFFLGRAGVAEVLGLKVAFLSGIYSPRVSEGEGRLRRTAKEKTYFVKSELGRVMAAGKDGAIDLLVTHDWPSGIGTDRMGKAAGLEQFAALDRRLRPSLHVCGHMHHRVSARLGEVQVEAVGHMRSGGDATCVVEWTGAGIVVHEPLAIPALPRDSLHGLAEPALKWH